MANILVVEDNDVALKAIRVLLERAGHSVIEAKDGKEGLQKVYKESCDMVISDIIMPYINGLQMLERIRGGHFKRDIGLIFVSSVDEEAAIAHAFNMGADDYIKKPLNPPELLTRVKRVLAKTEQRGAASMSFN